MQILDLEQIKTRIDVPRLFDAIEEGYALYSEGRVEVPPVGFLHFDDPEGDVHIKYGYIKGDSVYVIKVATGFQVPGFAGMQSDGLLLVFSQANGRLETVLLDECYLTDVRTAVGGAVAAKRLAPPTIRAIGILGTGVQARMQLEMLGHVIDCDRALVWGRTPERVGALIADVQSDETFWPRPLDLAAAPDVATLAAECDLIVTTTSARDPLLRAEHVRPGTHITAMGSDDVGKQELDARVLERADLVVADSRSQCAHHGETCHAIEAGLLDPESVRELGEVIRDPGLGRTSPDQVTVADLTGVAVQDIQIAKMVAASPS